MVIFKGESRLLQCAGEGNTPAVGSPHKPQTDRQGALTNLRLKGREAFTIPGKAVLIHGTHGTRRNNCQLHFPPSLFPSSPALAQTYLKTGQKCPHQMQSSMSHPRPREAKELWAKGP